VRRLKEQGLSSRYLKYPVYDLEPTGSRLNAYLRAGNPEGLTPSSVQELFAKNRRDFEPQLKSSLAEGINIVAEDYVGTGLAWGLTAGVKRAYLDKINADLLSPDLAILLDGERFSGGIEKGHRHEQGEGIWQRCRQIHLELAREFGWPIVNANQSREEVLRSIINTLLDGRICLC
jgi:thymidylate kinase